MVDLVEIYLNLWQICLPITRKDKKEITTKSVKGAKEAVENLSVEYFIGAFWLLIVYKVLFLLFYFLEFQLCNFIL